jgi:hypothetical protein
MIKVFLLSFSLVLSTFLFAQAPVSTASIFFETDRSELSVEARQTLDKLAPALLQAPDYQVNIEAFSDDRGTAQHNLRLAADRATAVQNYLAGKGLIADKTAVQNWGERKAESPTETGRQKSRRVDVMVNSISFKDFETLRDRLSANTEQVLKIQANQEQTVTAAGGTILVVPANAFVFEDGKTPKGEVELLVQEAYDPSDFILHNLTTLSDGHILQTGGMVNITARSGGRALQLAEGASLTVSLPNGGNFDPNMELFYAQPVSNGGVDWKPAGQKFRKTLKPNRVELVIDPALGARIAALKVPELSRPTMPAFKDQMPPEPKMPVAPYKPRAPKKPEWAAAQKLFAGSGDATRMSRKELKKAQLYFNDQMIRYTRDSAKYVLLAERYRRNVEGYTKAVIQFQTDHQQWEAELKNRLLAIMLYQRELWVYTYSKCLPKALKITAKTICDIKTYSNLRLAVSDAVIEQVYFALGTGMFDESKTKAIGTSMAANLYERIIGIKTMDTYKDFGKVKGTVFLALERDTTDRTTSRLLRSIGLQEISDSLATELSEKMLLNSNSPQQVNTIMGGYVATVSKLGWINCDRFSKDPAEKMQVLVNETEDATLYAICKDINAMLPFSRNAEGTYTASGLPKGKKITIVAIKIKDGMPQYAQRDIKVGDAALPGMVYRSLPLRDLKEELKKLNI